MDVRFIVRRNSLEEETYAVVEAVAVSKLNSDSRFRDALTSALSEWVAKTTAGRRAWKDSSQDFNVGDLSHWQSEKSLQPYLEKQGIRHLRVETFSEDFVCSHWSYDTVLVNEPEGVGVT